MKNNTLKGLLDDLDVIVTSIDGNPSSPNKGVAHQLYDRLTQRLNEIGSPPFPDTQTEEEEAETDIIVLTALKEAYTQAKGVGAHSLFRHIKVEKLGLEPGSNLKAGIASLTQKYFGREEEKIKNTTKFLNQLIQEKQSEEGWISPKGLK
ncbi:hypothetical protein [Legionella jamestowniensis]|uniref:Uncharacterized protein n=1 Tax=Legionella jamestowniensis TaxID=455 RepID=A0A0W0UIP4_9GAMM|nr:hypothetical protein [Legionella jamestowniensis]KTD07762.1 hypothetical protein Ljam_1957 [Legionella jamestowniensis]OCH99495.1 hypothetical protein A8135_07385 [Legionella jamestowniensis]SFL61783.1 hypothetical protein SAMN02746073_1078 [Legionella jamestowniensis DSM 19215]